MTSQEYSYSLKIPKDRIAVLIGKKGEIKEKLEKETSTKLKIDSEEGDVFITGKDALKLYDAREIILAIARGFNPEIAFLLLKADYSLEVINAQDFAKTKNALIRLRGRIIGSSGRSRQTIEELTGAYVSVYGKTVALIGNMEGLNLARRAIQMLLGGSPHRNVYKWLENQRRLRTLEE